MKCNICNKEEATVLYREIINGKESKYALCHDCAARKERENAGGLANLAGNLGGGLFDSFFSSSNPPVRRAEEKRCNLCGSSFRELAKSGRVGCPECYSVFADQLESTVVRLHTNAAHKGRVPARFVREETAEDKLSALEKELKAAIREERYEDAACVRDKIRILRSESAGE